MNVRFLLNGNATRRPEVQEAMISLLRLNSVGAKIEAKFHEASIKKFHGLHSKYMVTDKGGFLGSSNWSQDYFTTTAGLGFVFEVLKQTEAEAEPEFWRNGNISRILHGNPTSDHPRNMQEEMKGVFERDWDSELSVDITDETLWEDKGSDIYLIRPDF